MSLAEPDVEADLEVPDNPYTWLAIYAEAYNAADRTFWAMKQAHAALERKPSPAMLGHLDTLRERRKEAYSTLVAAVMTCEAQRQAAHG